MADFTSITFEANTGSNASPTWTNIIGANKELRWHNTATAGLAVASASWPSMVRPGSTGGVDYAYAYTADAVGLGVLGSAGNPTAWSVANYLQLRWNWDNSGTFAGAPVFTAYAGTSHAAITPGDGSALGGGTDTTNKSYLKGNAFGRVVSAGAPAAQPANDATVTIGTTGSVSPGAGANWLTNFQDLMGDVDYITAPFTPAATTADQWNVMLRKFWGPGFPTGLDSSVLTLRYAYS